MAQRNSNALRTELKQLLSDFPDTGTMELLIPDMHGVLKGKRIQARDFEKVCDEGFWFCAGTVLLTALGETVSGIPYGAEDGDPDAQAHLVPGSIAPIPWAEKPMAQALFRLTSNDGEAFFADPRAVLERALEPLRKMRLQIIMATELEFYLLDANSETATAAVPTIPGIGGLQPWTQVYHPDDLWEIEQFINGRV